MLAHAQVHRRAQRLLPAGIDTVALLSAAPLQRWECSPLSALPLGREGRGGVIGLRLHAATAQALRTGGAGFAGGAAAQSAAWHGADAQLRAMAAVEQRQLLGAQYRCTARGAAGRRRSGGLAAMAATRCGGSGQRPLAAVSVGVAGAPGSLTMQA